MFVTTLILKNVLLFWWQFSEQRRIVTRFAEESAHTGPAPRRVMAADLTAPKGQESHLVYSRDGNGLLHPRGPGPDTGYRNGELIKTLAWTPSAIN